MAVGHALLSVVFVRFVGLGFLVADRVGLVGLGFVVADSLGLAGLGFADSLGLVGLGLVLADSLGFVGLDFVGFGFVGLGFVGLGFAVVGGLRGPWWFGACGVFGGAVVTARVEHLVRRRDYLKDMGTCALKVVGRVAELLLKLRDLILRIEALQRVILLAGAPLRFLESFIDFGPAPGGCAPFGDGTLQIRLEALNVGTKRLDVNVGWKRVFLPPLCGYVVSPWCDRRVGALGERRHDSLDAPQELLGCGPMEGFGDGSAEVGEGVHLP